MEIKTVFATVIGIVGGIANGFFGSLTAAFYSLVIIMAADFVIGIGVALTNNSPKTKSGGLSSSVCFKGIVKKIIMLLLVGVTYRIQIVVDIPMLRDIVIMAFIANELMSILENAALMGIVLPEQLKRVIDILNDKGGEK